jgi:WhiB family redox-sensing transcriptional regulator
VTVHDGIRVRVAPGPRVLTGSGVFEVPRPPKWTEEANCISTDPELFHSETKGDRKLRDARKVCGNCVVREACLEWALETGDKHGTLGGLSARERQKLATGQRTCQICEIAFAGTTPNHKHCSRGCATEARRRARVRSGRIA